MRRSVSASVVVGALGLVLAGCAASTIPAVHSEAERLAVARRLATRGQWSVSIELLKTYIANNSGSADVDEAIYLLGECYLHTKDWALASAEFEHLLTDYPESDSSAAASFRQGEALFGQARPRDFDQEYALKALAQWQNYLRSNPGHWLNAEAERRIAATRRRLAAKLLDTGKLYVKLKLCDPARVYFRRVEQEYGDTGLAGEALLSEALCDARNGRKSQAIERLKQVEVQFPGQPIAAQAARERARLER